jgi:signal transduction histidine kinase
LTILSAGPFPSLTLLNIRELVGNSIEGVVIPQSVNVKIDDKMTNNHAMVDSEQMIQVLSNLIKNAIDAMPSGGDINITLEDNIGDVTITVRDNGTGIKEEDRAKIFEPFFTTKGIGHGTGLGLATAYGIVKMHKGQIVADSNTDPSKGPTGTGFRIILPRRKE